MECHSFLKTMIRKEHRVGRLGMNRYLSQQEKINTVALNIEKIRLTVWYGRSGDMGAITQKI